MHSTALETAQAVSLLERQTMRKVAWRLLPILMIDYFIAFIDRVNVGFAALQMNHATGLNAAAFGLGGGLFYDAPLAAYLDTLDRNDIARGMFEQSSFLRTDSSYLFAGLRASPGPLRGIAVVDAEVSTAQLREMDAAGVAGIRANLVGTSTVTDFSCSAWRMFLGLRIQHSAWTIEDFAFYGKQSPPGARGSNARAPTVTALMAVVSRSRSTRSR